MQNLGYERYGGESAGNKAQNFYGFLINGIQDNELPVMCISKKKNLSFTLSRAAYGAYASPF